MSLIERYGPPKEMWPRFNLDFTEAQTWPAKLNMAEVLVDENVRMGRGCKTAILCEDRTISYAELQLMVNRLGNALKSLNVKVGDRVLLRLANTPDFIVSHLATQKIGAVSVPIHPLWRAKEVSHIANDCEAKVLISTSQMFEEIEKIKDEIRTIKHIVVSDDGVKYPYISFDSLMDDFREATHLDPVRLDEDEIALLQYTSGTTGPPKGCIHTPREYLAVATCYAKKVLMANERDVWGGPVSMVFSFGHNALITDPFYCGAASSLLGNKRFEPAFMFELIEKHRITVLCAVPTAYRAMAALKGESKKYDLSSLRVCITAGEHCPPSLYTDINELFGCEVLNHIGCTELHHAFLSARFGQVKPGSLGLPVPGYTVKILDEENKKLPSNEIGYLVVMGPTGTRYWKNPEKQAEAVKGGWNYTGDLAYKDEDGFFWYASRCDDIMKTAAYRVSPNEVEEILMKHPAVVECGVTGAPDPERGEIVKAFVVLRLGYAPNDELKEEIRNFVRNFIAPYKAPREIKFVQELPKTETGKLKRTALRRIALEDLKLKNKR